MTKSWLIADTHFRHKNILEFEKRPFISVNEMEASMINAWNEVVGKNDIVYLIGDFCFGDHKAWIEILEQLKGRIILIKGNHDKSKVIERVKREGYLEEIHYVGHYMKLDGLQIYLTHFPLDMGERPLLMNIHGHIHAQESTLVNQINVGVDSPFMEEYYNKHMILFGAPVPLDYVMEAFKERNALIQEKYVR